jgi:hypothetical protein
MMTAIAVASAAVSQPAIAANIMTNWTSITVFGNSGVLRAGSPWGPGSTPTDLVSPVDGLFEPEAQQWNNGSFWWDQDPSVNQSPVTWEVQLDQAYTVDRFLVQADDNDSYLLEYWDGAAWQSAYAVPFDFSFGLQTRDSGILGPITTDRFRFSATAGDNYYAVSEIQAFQAVPEASTWMMMIIGFGLVGSVLRRRRPKAQLQFA